MQCSRKCAATNDLQSLPTRKYVVTRTLPEDHGCADQREWYNELLLVNYILLSRAFKPKYRLSLSIHTCASILIIKPPFKFNSKGCKWDQFYDRRVTLWRTGELQYGELRSSKSRCSEYHIIWLRYFLEHYSWFLNLIVNAVYGLCR